MNAPHAAPLHPPVPRRPAPARARAWAPYLFIAPFFLLFAVFGLFPLLFSIYLSLQQWNPAEGLHTMHWVGLENYWYAVTDPWFHDSLYNTFWFALVSGLPQHLVALPLAFFIHQRVKRGRNLLVGAYFVPYITSSVAIALIFSTLYSKDYGLINAVLAELTRIPFLGSPVESVQMASAGAHAGANIGAIDWLGDSDYTRPAVAFVVFWRFLGWNLVLYLSALQVIDKDLYEAATLDGASSWQQFRFVTLPLLKPMMFFAVTLTIIGNLQLFEEPFILVDMEKGVSQSVMTSAIFMYRLAFSEGDFGTASAVSWLLFFIIAALTWLNARLFGRDAGGQHAAR